MCGTACRERGVNIFVGIEVLCIESLRICYGRSDDNMETDSHGQEMYIEASVEIEGLS